MGAEVLQYRGALHNRATAIWDIIFTWDIYLGHPSGMAIPQRDDHIPDGCPSQLRFHNNHRATSALTAISNGIVLLPLTIWRRKLRHFMLCNSGVCLETNIAMTAIAITVDGPASQFLQEGPNLPQHNSILLIVARHDAGRRHLGGGSRRSLYRLCCDRTHGASTKPTLRNHVVDRIGCRVHIIYGPCGYSPNAKIHGNCAFGVTKVH